MLINTHGEYNTPPEWEQRKRPLLRSNTMTVKSITGDQILNVPDKMNIKKFNLASCAAGNAAYMSRNQARKITKNVCDSLSMGQTHTQTAIDVLQMADMNRSPKIKRRKLTPTNFYSEYSSDARLHDKTFVWYSSDRAGDDYEHLDEIIMVLNIGEEVKYYTLLDIIINSTTKVDKKNAGTMGTEYKLQLSDLLSFLKTVLFEGIDKTLDITIVDNSCGDGGQFLSLLSNNQTMSPKLYGGKPQKIKTKTKLKRKTKLKHQTKLKRKTKKLKRYKK